jgi:hypothetical protein
MTTSPTLYGNCLTVRSKDCDLWWGLPSEGVTETFPAATIYHPSQSVANCIALEFVEGRLDESISCATCCHKVYCLSSTDPDINSKLLYASVDEGFMFSAATDLVLTPVATYCNPTITSASPVFLDGLPPVLYPPCADLDETGCQWSIPGGRLFSFTL